MLTNQLYTTHQIVWAKLQPYPWWPAKIVKTLQQSKQTLYKILFFADKTYSYLHSDHLQNFDTFNPPADQSFINPQTQKMLQKAIKLVQEHRNKSLKLKKMKKHDQIIENQQIQGQRLEKKSVVIMEEKNEYGNDKLCVQIGGSIFVQRWTSTDSISTMNVIEMIEATRRPQKKLDYCYEKRKQQICHIKFLKQKLLLKYNLLQISKKTESKINKKSQSIIIHNQKTSQKIYKAKPINKSYVLNNYKAKRQPKHDIETLKHKSANKIKKMLSSSLDDPEYIRRESKDIIRRIIFLSDHSQIKFHSLILTLIKSIATSNSYAKCDEKLIDFKHYLQRLEHEKQWDEQGSKLTQIEGMG